MEDAVFVNNREEDEGEEEREDKGCLCNKRVINAAQSCFVEK